MTTKNILRELAQSSAIAQELIGRLSTSSSIEIETIENLKTKIAEQQSQIQTLTYLLNEEQQEEQYSDEDIAETLQSLQSTFLPIERSILIQGYAASRLKIYPTNLRYIVALALLNVCAIKEYQPDPIWQQVVAKHGAF